MTVMDKEINAVISNLTDGDTLVIFRSYNEVAYPADGVEPFSVIAYTKFIEKVRQCFVIC
jgi:hypothetical protein